MLEAEIQNPPSRYWMKNVCFTFLEDVIAFYNIRLDA